MPLANALYCVTVIVTGIAISFGSGIILEKHPSAVGTKNGRTRGKAKHAPTSLSRDSGRDSFGDHADKGAEWTKFAAQTIKRVQGGIGEMTHE
jgi:hypothetical protein